MRGVACGKRSAFGEIASIAALHCVALIMARPALRIWQNESVHACAFAYLLYMLIAQLGLPFGGASAAR